MLDKIFRPILAAILFVSMPIAARAGDQSVPLSSGTAPSLAASDSDSRYGLFNWLDHRSAYGLGVFPEPFLVDDSDLEVNEIRFDWLHTEGKGQQTDLGTFEIEKGFGLLTLELEVPYERDAASGEHTAQGMSNIDVGARYPIYQFVSRGGWIDSTFGVGMEIGIPTNSAVSKNAEFVPKVFNDLKIKNFTLQTVLGYSTLTGSGEDGGLQNFEYGFVFGYTIPHEQLPIPGVQQLIPVLEISGEKQLNHESAGQNSVVAMAGFRANTRAIGRVQPRLGLGFVFPMNEVARQDTHWGVYTSLVFEY
jgi:hypothetical protein